MTFKLSNNKYYTPASLARLAKSSSDYSVEAMLVLEDYLTTTGKHHIRLQKQVERYRMNNPSAPEDVALEEQYEQRSQEFSAKKWCRDLVERYAHGDDSVIEMITETPYGRVLLSLFEQAASGSTKASDQIFKLLGAYAPTKTEVDASVGADITTRQLPPLFELPDSNG